MRHALLPLSFALAGALALAGCNEDPGADNGEGDHKPDPLPASTSTLSYPEPPYDLSKGAVIDDFQFQGFPNSMVSREELETIRFSDFYNPRADDPSPLEPPDDDRLFPPGSPYGEGTKKPRVLLVNIASVWCSPCQQEAKNLFPGKYAKYNPCGGEIFFGLVESNAPGTEATQSDLEVWTKNFKVNYPAMLDAGRQLSQLYAAGTFPANAIVDTRTMRIQEIVAGPPEEGFWTTFESLLETECLAGQ